ncbi:MAG: serine hydrolase domain-containing protein [Thermomicrobiales bacterium]
MTTMMMASEVDAGVLTWDQPAVAILPTFRVADPALSKTVTIRNLVCACTGVPRRDLEFLFNANRLTARDVVASLRDFKIFTKFGEAFQYSNQMVATGGYIAASAEPGASSDLYADYLAALQRRVLDPIGMTRTTFSIAAVESGGDYASPHGATLKGAYEPLPLATEGLLQPIAPAGSAWSTANDMARYLMTEIAKGVAPDGRRVVSAANLAETWKPQVAVDAQTGYGLGWFVQETDGLELIFHGGNTLGFTSDLAFLPDAGIGIVVLANGQTSNVFNKAVRNRLLELLYAQPMAYGKIVSLALDQAAASLAAARASVGDYVDEPAARPYLGDYANDRLGAVTVALDASGHLSLDAGEFKTGLLPATDPASGKSGYIAEDPPLAGIPFEFRSDGSIVLSAGTDEYVFKKREPSTSATPEASPSS